MKALIILGIVVAGLTAQAAVIQTSNADCREQKRGPLWEVTQPQPPARKAAPTKAPTQEASVKQKAQSA